MTGPEPDREPSVTMLGVPLLQLAAVHAATAEGFELQQVLELEGLDSERWTEAQAQWTDRMANDALELDCYSELLAEHQDRLGRPIQPLDSDLAAWVCFLRVFADADDGFALLADSGMQLNDLARLQRRWGRVIDDEPKVAKHAEKLADELDEQVRKGRPPKMPAINVGQSQLVASTAAQALPSERAPDTATTAAGSVPMLGLDEYAALSAELRLGDDEQDRRALLRFGLTAAQALAIDEAWRARLECDRELKSDYRILSSHYEQAILLRWKSRDGVASMRPAPTPWSNDSADGPSAPLPALPLRAPADEPVPAKHTTEPGAVLAHVEALPFQPGIPSLVPTVMSVAPASASVADTGRTGKIIPALRDAATTPFGLTPAPASDADTERTGKIDPALRDAAITPFGLTPPASDADTERTGKIILAPASAADTGRTGKIDPALRKAAIMPFGKRGTAQRTMAMKRVTLDGESLPFAGAISAGAPLGIGLCLGAQPTDLDETAEPASQQPEDSVLPFKASPASTAEPQPAASERASPAEPKRHRHSKRVHRRADPLADTTTIRNIAVDETSATSSRPAGADGELPELTIEQYASLRAELAVRTRDAATIRRRYRIPSHAALRALEQRWSQRLANSSRDRRLYQSKLDEFLAWLLKD